MSFFFVFSIYSLCKNMCHFVKKQEILFKNDIFMNRLF